MSAPVLDASAVLALIRDEPGAALVEAHLDGALLSAANLAEVLSKHVDHGVDPTPVPGWLRALGLVVEPVTDTDAEVQAGIRARDREQPGGPLLSLGDRLCLAIALRRDASVLTADQAWARLELPVDVQLIR